MVAAERASGFFRPGISKIFHGVQADKSADRLLSLGDLSLPVLLCQNGRSDGTHHARIRRSRHIFPQVLLQSPKHRVIAESSSLYHDPLSQRIQVRHTDYLGKHVLDNRPAQACHDILRLPSAPLCRDDAAVHKYRTPASQRRRTLRGECGLGDHFHRNMQGRRKILQERTAAGRAGLINHNIGDHAPVQPDRLHILSADIQKESCVRHIFRRRPCVRHGFHHMIFRRKCFFKQQFPVSGRTCRQDGKLRPGFFPAVSHGQQRFSRHLERFSRVGSIERIQDILLFIHQDKFRRGTSGVNTQISPYFLPRLRMPGIFRNSMAAHEFLFFFLIFKKDRRPARGRRVAFLTDLFQTGQKSIHIRFRRSFRKKFLQGQSRPVSYHDLRMLRNQHFFFRKFQTLGKHPDQLRIEGHRTALEKHRAFDIQALGQTAYGLLRDRMERRQRQVRLGHSLVQQRLNIRLGIYAAASGDIIYRFSLLRRMVQLFYRNPQDRRHLVQKSARTSCTASVHSHVRHIQPAGLVILTEKQYLGVLAAQLDGRAHLLVQFPDRNRIGDYFLHIRQAQPVRQLLRSGAGQRHAEFRRRETLFQAFQAVDHALHLLRAVSPVIGICNLICVLIHSHDLRRG